MCKYISLGVSYVISKILSATYVSSLILKYLDVISKINIMKNGDVYVLALLEFL